MNKYQRSLINCYCSLMKEWVNIYGYNDEVNSYSLEYSSLKIYTNKNKIEWNFLEKIKEVTDKSNVCWRIYSQDDNLIIELFKN